MDRGDRHFSKEGIEMIDEYMTICSGSLIIKKMHMKATMKVYLTCVRMTIIK